VQSDRTDPLSPQSVCDVCRGRRPLNQPGEIGLPTRDHREIEASSSSQTQSSETTLERLGVTTCSDPPLPLVNLARLEDEFQRVGRCNPEANLLWLRVRLDQAFLRSDVARERGNRLDIGGWLRYDRISFIIQ
jgi:hypothetical protein